MLHSHRKGKPFLTVLSRRNGMRGTACSQNCKASQLPGLALNSHKTLAEQYFLQFLLLHKIWYYNVGLEGLVLKKENMEGAFIYPFSILFKIMWMMPSLVPILRLASVPGKVNSVFEVLLMIYRNFCVGSMWNVNKEKSPSLSWAFLGWHDLHESGKRWTEAPTETT